MLMVAFAAVMPLMADTEDANGFTWYYRIINNNTEAEIYNNNNIAISPDNRSDIVMPDTLGGKPVTSIGDYAFSGCKLMGITIPDGVTSIGIEAFYGCRNLKGVIIPDSVIFIGARAFSRCGAIKSVGIPQCVCTNQLSVVFPNAFSAIINIVIAEGVTDIGDSAFAGCSALNSITIPESVTNIATNAFSGCSGLTNVTMPATLRRTVEVNEIFGASSNVNIEYYSASIVHQVESYDCAYDGEGHGIDVEAMNPENAVIKYAYEEQGPYAEDAILFTNALAEAVTIWYTVEADDYATVTNSGTVMIRQKTLTDEMVTVADVPYTCDGTAKEPSVTVADGVPSIITQDDYDVSYANNVNAGTADVIVTGKRNYTGSVTKHFTIEARPITTIGDYLNWSEQEFTMEGDVGWTQVEDVSHEDGYALRSGGNIDDSQESVICTIVQGAGTISFWCKVSSEVYKGRVCDGFMFSVDGLDVIMDGLIGGEIDWTNLTFAVDGDGVHTLRWRYVKDDRYSDGADCAWLDEVTWTPADGLTAWLAERGLSKDDVMVNGRTAAECYVLGLDPTDATTDFRIVSFSIVDGEPDVEWVPKTNRWTGAEINATLKGATNLHDRVWSAVRDVSAEDRAALRFFKVEVE